MKRNILIGMTVAVAIGVASIVAIASNDPEPVVERIDFGQVQHETEPAYRSEVEPASTAPVKEFRIPVTHDTIEIAAGVTYEGWTFGGTVPGPVIRVREGDRVVIQLVNESPMPHSIDFHSARIPMNEAYRSINPGEELTFEFTAKDPGAYLVHCGTAPVLMHIMQGMYLPIIVDPKGGWGTDADREFVLLQSEFYAQAGERTGHLDLDYDAAQDKRASHVVFNGRANQYRSEPLMVDEGDRVRFFVVNAGPSLRSDFHVVGAVFDRVYPDGNPANVLESVQTWTVPTGGGAVFEAMFEEGDSGEGTYAFVTHAFADAEKGAVGLIQVGQPQVAAGAGH